jgi:hypothetical protein
MKPNRRPVWEHPVFVIGIALAAVAALAAYLLLREPESTFEAQLARETADRILTESRVLLLREIGLKGAAGATEACAAVAQEIARKKEQEGWRVRRVSERFRNPADAPDDFERRVLQRWAAEHRRKPLPPETEFRDTVREGGRSYLRYMKPIVIQSELCLTCHGPAEKLDAEVKAKLDALYPQDQARDYRVGDLRGAISVKIPL